MMIYRPLHSLLLLGALCAALAACGAAPRAPRAARAFGPTAQPTAEAPAATAARSQPTAPAATPAVLADLGGGGTITLALGETASLGADGASVSFERVVEDSRCPANAHCVWQGRVVVEGSVSVGGQTLPFTLGTLEGFADAPASVRAGPYTLSIAGVEPYPETPAGVPADAYVLSLALEERP
ncbi:MAG TPA: hypothetical protein PKD53_17160 [Chloroflexaceae bacterium]|nr:hypothetical protein [Chloroflexaceae bacterium]